jgi:HD domain
MRRRELLKTAGALGVLVPLAGLPLARAAALPTQVAGVALPRTPLAQRAAAYARASCPAFLYNHCLRTFVFGALQLQRQQLACREEEAFIAAALHDLGLLPAFETPRGPFEVDGADAAEHWLHAQGEPAQLGDRIWHDVQMHDGPWPLTRRQGAEAQLVALGAGIDVVGPDPGEVEPRALQEILAAFPRLSFKREFTALLIAHCQRKPAAQRATWLEGLCRAHVSHPLPDTAVEQRIAAAAFSE